VWLICLISILSHLSHPWQKGGRFIILPRKHCIALRVLFVKKPGDLVEKKLRVKRHGAVEKETPKIEWRSEYQLLATPISQINEAAQ